MSPGSSTRATGAMLLHPPRLVATAQSIFGLPSRFHDWLSAAPQYDCGPAYLSVTGPIIGTRRLIAVLVALIAIVTCALLLMSIICRRKSMGRRSQETTGQGIGGGLGIPRGDQSGDAKAGSEFE